MFKFIEKVVYKYKFTKKNLYFNKNLSVFQYCFLEIKCIIKKLNKVPK